MCVYLLVWVIIERTVKDNSPGRGERAQRRGCRKTSVFLSRETGISGNFVGRIKSAKCPFDLQFLTWDFS